MHPIPQCNLRLRDVPVYEQGGSAVRCLEGSGAGRTVSVYDGAMRFFSFRKELEKLHAVDALPLPFSYKDDNSNENADLKPRRECPRSRLGHFPTYGERYGR